MSAVPWSLELELTAPTSLCAALPFDDASGLLLPTVSFGGRREAGSEAGPGIGISSLEVPEVRLCARLDLPARGGSLWLQGRYMQRDALVRRLGSFAPEGYGGEHLLLLETGRRYISAEVVVVTLPAQPVPSLLLGATDLQRFFVDLQVELDPEEQTLRSLSVVYLTEGTVLAPGQSLALPSVLILQGEDPVALLERYAERLAQTMHARVPQEPPTGWCSWYYFYNRVSQQDVLENLQALEELGRPLQVVQVDDGFQAATGDWLIPNERFAGGMEQLARRISQARLRPGLWLSPLVMHESSDLLARRPETALRTRDGGPYRVQSWLGPCAVMDCTHPAAEDCLRQVTRTVVHQWGYTYLKLDALAFAAAPGDEVAYHRPGTTGPENLRRGLSIIREEAGDEVFLLGCTCPFGPAVGLVDGMRVGPDVKALWSAGPRPSVRHAMRMTLQRNWMHGRLWANDPDCLLLRETRTELSEHEVRFLATAVALSGGAVFISDHLPRLGRARLDLALALLPPGNVAARPLDPFEQPVASVWRADRKGGQTLLGLLNWGDEPRKVDLASVLGHARQATDVLGRRILDRRSHLELAPHEGVLLLMDRI